jgi:hypothetical protein
MPQAARHFDITEWADYARSLATPEQHSQMQAHLAAGCLKCEKIEQLFARFASVCTRECAYMVPEGTERRVKALFSIGSEPRLTPLQRMWAALVYDSANDPQPVGVRGTHQINRQVMFHAGDYSVDLRFEHEKGSASMVLVGQISNQKTPEDLMANVPVILLAGEREVTRSMSNSFGEFQMEYVPGADLRLLMPLENRGHELEVILGQAPQA